LLQMWCTWLASNRKQPERIYSMW